MARFPIDAELAPPGTRLGPRKNLGAAERGLSLAAGTLAAGLAARQRGLAGMALGLVSSLLVARGLTGSSTVLRTFGEAPDEQAAAKLAGWSSAAVVGRSVTINAQRAAVFERFRDIGRWPSFMVNIARIDVLDAQRSHWVVEAPGGQTVEWDATITEEQPGDFIAWSSDPGASVPNAGRIEFRDAGRGRGTEVHATVVYRPPGGSLGRYLAKLTQQEPGIQARRDLKRFKSLIETGEIATNAPQGTQPTA